MLQIRLKTFETNSSSTHSIAIYTDAEFEDMNKKKEDPEYLLASWEDKFYTIDEFIAKGEASDWEHDRETARKIKEFVAGRKLEECLYEEFEEYDSFEEYLNDELELKSINYRNGDNYDWYSNLEEDYTQYTTPGGEHLHIICKYGRDS